MGGRDGAAPRHPGLPGRPVERARRIDHSTHEHLAAAVENVDGYCEDQAGEDAVERVLLCREVVGEYHSEQSTDDPAGNEFARDRPVNQAGESVVECGRETETA